MKTEKNRGFEKGKSQGSAKFQIHIGDNPAETFVPNQVIGSLSATLFEGDWPNRIEIRYGTSLALGEYKFDASQLFLPFSYRGQDLVHHERDGRASGSVIVTVRTLGNEWQVSGNLNVTYSTPKPTIRLEGNFVFLVNPTSPD
ncbi:hypothetical protein [Pseudomonas reactans]